MEAKCPDTIFDLLRDRYRGAGPGIRKKRRRVEPFVDTTFKCICKKCLACKKCECYIVLLGGTRRMGMTIRHKHSNGQHKEL